MSGRQQFTAADACGITEVSQRCLDYWDKTDFLKPSGSERRVGKADGRGGKRLYTFEDLVKLRTVKRLRDAGIELQTLRKALRKLSPRGRERSLLLQALKADGRRLEWRRGDGKIVDLSNGGQMVFSVISIHHVESEVKRLVIGRRQQDSLLSNKGTRQKSKKSSS